MTKKKSSPVQGDPSLSDIIVAFAAPLLHENMDVAEYEAALKLAGVIWNLPFLSPPKRAEARQRILDRFLRGSPLEAMTWANRIDEMIRTREHHFVGDPRFLTSVALVQRKGRWDVQTDYSIAPIPGEAAPAEPSPAGS